MQQLILILVLAIIITNTSAQTSNSNEIVAEGGAKTKVKPDVASFTLSIEKNDSIEKTAILSLNAEMDKLVKSLYKIGFTNKTIHISDYDIASSMNDNNKKTYTAPNALKIECRLDNKLIDALYNEIQVTGFEDLDLSFNTKLSDSLEKAEQLRLVRMAIDDAKTNANNIREALGINIIRVKQVHKHSEGLFDPKMQEIVLFTPPKIVKDTQFSYKTTFDKFDVEDIDLEESIKIVYEISKYINYLAAELTRYEYKFKTALVAVDVVSYIPFPFFVLSRMPELYSHYHVC